MNRPQYTIALLGILCAGTLWAAPVTITIEADKPGAAISPTMWGIFFEDINFGADGGLCAEKIKNRSFEFPEGLMGWTELKSVGSGSLQVLDTDPATPVNPHYLRLKANKAGYGVASDGFRGIGVQKDDDYVFSTMIRTAGDGKAALRIELVTKDGKVLAQAALPQADSKWSRPSVTLRPSATELKARLQIVADTAGTVDLDWVSLVPKKTWKDRPNGLRTDVVQWLADLKPGFLRFPGGCIVEGSTVALRYQWKKTIGKPEDRPLLINRWNQEFKHRPAPDYFQSFQLGFFEYFQLCEDIGAEPLPILNCGMACQFNSGELVPLDKLDPYIQDALDLVEFANGPADSKWGKIRAEMGHAKPFGMKFLGVGNEQWGPQYIERYELFAKALKARYPDIKLISSAGPSPDDERFQFLWPKLRQLKADIVDEHCYANPEWFFDSAARYDKYDRKGPKVFMGEYAAQSVKTVSPDNRNNWRCALSEAAFMTGMERNADVVVMSSYAPLLAQEDLWQWRPDLIWFDNLQSYGTPNYYVQQLFSCNRGDFVLPARVDGQSAPTSKKPGLYVTAAGEKTTGQIILKVVNSADQAVASDIKLKSVKSVLPVGIQILLTAKATDENSIASPDTIIPVESIVSNAAASFQHSFAPLSVTVLRLTIRD
jgi:alpha-N-arabinofuranosidase